MAKSYLESLLGEREKIIMSARQHWMVFFQEIIAELITGLAILVLVTLVLTMIAPVPLVALFYLVLIVPLVSLLRDYLNWRNNEYVITNRRVIHLQGVFNKNVIDSSLEKVNDVKMMQTFFGRLLGYADFEILTASELGVNRFTKIGDPIRFKTAMINAKEELETERHE